MWLFSPHLKLQHYSPGTAACGLYLFFIWPQLKLQHYSHGTAACGLFFLPQLKLQRYSPGMAACGFFTSPETAACSRAAQWAGWWWSCAVHSWSPPGLPPPRPGLTPHAHTHRPPVTRGDGIPTGCHHPARGQRKMDYSSSITQWGNNSLDRLQGADIRFPKCG